MPWLLERLGLPLPEGLAPVDLAEGVPFQLSEVYGSKGRARKGPDQGRTDQISFREGNFKVVLFSTGQTELYDVSVDREELHDLADAEPRIAAELGRRARAWIEARRKEAGDTEGDMDPKEIERLRELGYLQ